MKVVAAINGSLVAEGSAFLALQYAKQQSLDLLLLHVKNEKDSLESVDSSFKEITHAAIKEGVACETMLLEGKPYEVIPHYLQSLHIDTFFCSTRIRQSYFTNSFSERLLKMHLDTDVAVVRIVHMNNFKELDGIMLPIKDAKLSVRKFTFVSTLATAYESDVEIFSLSMTTKNRLAKFDMSLLRERFARINFDLRHYKNLSQLMPFKLKIKHEFSSNETQSMLHHIAVSDCQLVIVGAKRFSFFSFLRSEKPIETLLKQSSKNMIAYYPKED